MQSRESSINWNLIKFYYQNTVHLRNEKNQPEFCYCKQIIIRLMVIFYYKMFIKYIIVDKIIIIQSVSGCLVTLINSMLDY